MQGKDKTIVTRINRAPEPMYGRFKEFYSGLLVDAMGKLGIMSRQMKPLESGMRVCGPAVTSMGPDLTVRRMAIDLMQPNDVLVVAAGGTQDYACFGDGTATRMMTKNLGGAVIDGCVRDAAGLRRLNFPTFCLGVSSRNYHYPAGLDYGAVNVPVVCSGVLITPGDLVFGDDDGVVVVPQSMLEAVYVAVKKQFDTETIERDGWTTYPEFGVRDELARRGYTFSEVEG